MIYINLNKWVMKKDKTVNDTVNGGQSDGDLSQFHATK